MTGRVTTRILSLLISVPLVAGSGLNSLACEIDSLKIHSTIRSREPNDDDLHSQLGAFLDEAAARDAFSGAVLVAKNGQPIFKKAYGLANQSTKAANNEETKFNIGSITKIFTAVAIAQLAERGKLAFDDPISKHLPKYENQDVARKVTIHHLLTHTSGLGDYLNDKFYSQLDKMKTVDDLLPLFVDEPLNFEPGTKWMYSNSGYVVLGAIIEKVSGRDYFSFVKQHVFNPAGMSNTDFYERDARVSNLATGYTRMSPGVGKPDPSTPRRDNTYSRPAKGSPAGGAYSTVDDLLKFVAALSNHKLLSKKSTELLTTGKVETGGIVGKYAYGFGDKIFQGKHIVGHNGGAPGIGANLDIFPELGYTAIILSNYDPSSSLFPVIMKIRQLIPAPASMQ